MDDTSIIPVVGIVDERCQTLLPAPTDRPTMTPAAMLTVAVVAARSVGNHLERPLRVMAQPTSIPQARRLRGSRFNRQLRRESDVLSLGLETLLARRRTGAAFIIARLPVPGWKRTHARRCRKVCGRACCGSCAAKTETCFGRRRHPICTPQGQPVAFALLPGTYHDLTPMDELTVAVPKGAAVSGDNAYNDATGERFLLDDGGVRLVPIRKKNKKPHDWADAYDLRRSRKRIETVHSQRERIGRTRLQARTHRGFDIKVHASLIALWHTQTMAK
ncbi:MAG: hypothetical protein ACUVWS_17740 [Roseiflexus sp.]